MNLSKSEQREKTEWGKQRLRNLWNNNTSSKIYITRGPEDDEKECGTKKVVGKERKTDGTNRKQIMKQRLLMSSILQNRKSQTLWSSEASIQKYIDQILFMRNPERWKKLIWDRKSVV